VLRESDVDFLITNDDGIEAEGLQSLYRAIAQIGSVAVVAPDTVRSCCSHAVTTAESLEVYKVDACSWKVSGTPADCVRVAIKYLKIRPKWVLSGVNEGGNLGVDIHYSGTVAGAREAALLGFSSMSISQYLRRDRPRNWPVSAQRAIYAWKELRSIKLPIDQFWNVNLPVVDPIQTELPVVHVEPESQMLGYEFESIDDSPQSVGSAPAWQEGATALDQTTRCCQIIKYCSNYQMRPRSDSFDVAECFSGKITVSRLKTALR